jgi:hypothetical protein
MTRYATTAEEDAVDARLTQYMSDARSGKAQPKPWQPRHDALDLGVRRALGIEAPEAAPATPTPDGLDGIQIAAWKSLTREEQDAVIENAGSPTEAFAAAYDRELAAAEEYTHLSRAEQLARAGLPPDR